MPTIGQQLKQAREARRLSIPQVMQATRIRTYYLEAMETDDFSSMPSAAQARGFLRSYAEFLGLNADELITDQRNRPEGETEFTTPDQPEPATTPQALAQAVIVEPEPVVETETAPEPEPEPEPPVEIEPPKPPGVSHFVFAEIGNQLRQRRELLSLTLDEIERHTHVRRHYLTLIEKGDFDELPSPVQARGMLNNYANFLDMDTDALLLRFADALQARRLERQAGMPAAPSPARARISAPLWLRRFATPDLMFGGGMIVLLFLLALWGAARIFSGEANPPVQTQGPSISDVLLASPVASTEQVAAALPTSVSVSSAGSEIGQTPTDIVLSGDAGSVLRVTISVLERTFVRISVDGVVKQEGRVVPGAALTFEGSQSIEILTGSGSAIQVLFNQRNLGVMGNYGEVIDRIYTFNGIETPTTTPTPTATITPRFQRTPTLTPTPSITITPTGNP